jgi:hypothetical protein
MKMHELYLCVASSINGPCSYLPPRHVINAALIYIRSTSLCL